jgi:ABC-type sugar transport system ATPase subunit
MRDRRAHPGDVVLEVQGLTKSFAKTVVLDGVNLSLASRTLTVITGQNGVGKSTLLECLAGAQPFDSGTLKLNGRIASPQD